MKRSSVIEIMKLHDQAFGVKKIPHRTGMSRNMVGKSLRNPSVPRCAPRTPPVSKL